MRRVAEVGDLVADALRQHEAAAVLQFGMQFAFQHVEHMTAIAPVVGQVTRTVFDYAYAQVTDME